MLFQKMFAAVFTFAFITVYVAAEVPSYIHVCGRRDPNIDQCILNNVENLKTKICDGIPELNIQSNNPVFIKELTIYDTSDNKIYMRDTKLTGMCDYAVNSFHIDIDKLHFNVDLLFKQIQINSTYNINLHLLGTPIVNNAQIYITTDNIGAKVDADLTVVTKNGQRYVYLSQMKLNLDIKGYNTDFDQSQREEFNQLQDIIRNFMGNNQEEILKRVKPIIEEVITKQILSVSNGIVKNFTYDELFPDRT